MSDSATAQPTQPAGPQVQAAPQPAPQSVPQQAPQPQAAPAQSQQQYTAEELAALQQMGLPENFKPQPEEVIVEWQAPNRPFKKRNPKYYSTLGIIVLLIGLILFFAGQFLAIAVVLAVAFLAYVLSAVPPEMVINKITTYGIRTDNLIYYWDECSRFWYTTKYNQRLLHIEVSRFPNHLTLLLGDIPEEEMTEILSEVLLQEQPAPTQMEKAAAWLEEKIPLDTEA